jgi:hypothetical protein
VCGEFISATSFSLLQKLGISDLYREESGPEIHRIGIFVSDKIITSPMPELTSNAQWSRVYGREHFDTALLNRHVLPCL